jgi:hypothetical protein
LLHSLEKYQWAIDLLQTMPGIDVTAAITLIVEFGTDLSAFGSPDKLASWAGLCPGQNESAGKRYKGHIRKGNKYVRQVMTEAAHAASRTKNCVLQDKYQSIVAIKGRKRSIVALAHKMLRIIYRMLKNKEPYKDSQINYEQIRVTRNAPRWIRALQQYGYIKDLSVVINKSKVDKKVECKLAS